MGKIEKKDNTLVEKDGNVLEITESQLMLEDEGRMQHLSFTRIIKIILF